MTASAFCAHCKRTVYIDDTDTDICPVCSNPLISTIEPPAEAEEEPEASAP